MSHNLSLGKRGEDIAAQYLEKKRYRIVARNWRSKPGEIDIIAEKNGVFIFVEVKTRTTSAFGYPEEAVTATKRQHLLRATELYCQMHRVNGLRRIDVIAITDPDASTPTIVHLEDAVAGV